MEQRVCDRYGAQEDQASFRIARPRSFMVCRELSLKSLELTLSFHRDEIAGVINDMVTATKRVA